MIWLIRYVNPSFLLYEQASYRLEYRVKHEIQARISLLYQHFVVTRRSSGPHSWLGSSVDSTLAHKKKTWVFTFFQCISQYHCIVLYWRGGHCCPMHCDLFKIYCALRNLGITRTWICRLNFAQRPIFWDMRFFNEPEISDSGLPASSPSRRTCAQDF